MGQHHSELHPKDMETLQTCTPFTKDEISGFYQEFIKQYPNGLIARDDLRKVYKKAYPKGDPDELVEEMFRLYDKNMSGRIDFREFLCGLGFMHMGGEDEKLKMAFSIYDHDESGTVNIDELRNLVQAIYKATATANKKYDEQEANKVGSVMFSRLDVNQDGRVTVDEFIQGAKADESIMNMISMLDVDKVAHQKKK